MYPAALGIQSDTEPDTFFTYIYTTVYSTQYILQYTRLVFCHESLHMLQKIQNAGYVPEIERWVFDLDSDDSADEAAADGDEKLLRLMV